MKVIVTGGRDYVDNGALWFTLDCVRAFATVAFHEFNGPPATSLIIAHGACGWDLDRDGPLYDPHDPRLSNKLRGADAVAHRFALHHQLEVRCYPADWSKGPSGGPKRNRHMFHVEQPQLVVAAPGGPGTAGMCDIVREAGVLLWTVEPWRS
jgi:hypothetical protein